MDGLAGLLDRLLGLGIDRSTTLVAFGGGVAGESCRIRGRGGAARPALHPGCRPRLLAPGRQLSVGGKTRVNSRHGKNRSARFHRPRLGESRYTAVPRYPAAAPVMPRGLCRLVVDEVRQLSTGPAFFDWLVGRSRRGRSWRRRRGADPREIAESCRAKPRSSPPTNASGPARPAQPGHTFGHALEARDGLLPTGCCMARRGDRDGAGVRAVGPPRPLPGGGCGAAGPPTLAAGRPCPPAWSRRASRTGRRGDRLLGHNGPPTRRFRGGKGSPSLLARGSRHAFWSADVPPDRGARPPGPPRRPAA